ncbi:MAG TPA: prolyl oligopeptidase family serine peptidase [Thermoanaerobaculia bacterium]
MRGRALVGWEPEGIRWSADSKKVYFRWKQASDSLEKDLDTYVVNRDGSGLRKLTEDEAKHAPPLRGVKSKDKKRTVYAEDGDLYLFDSAAGSRRNLTKTVESESNPRFTKDEKRVAFVRSNNLFVLSLADGSIAQMTNIVGAEDKGPNVSLWDEKKGTESQEFLKKEERELLDIIERRAKKREEEEAKRKRENPRKPFKLERRQTVMDLQLTPDETRIVVFLSVENDKAKRTIVPAYVTESAYADTLPAREKVGDAVSANKMAVLDVATGDAKWLEHGLKQIENEEPKRVESETKEKSEEVPPEERVQASAQRTEKSEPKEREVGIGPLVWSEDGAKAVLSLRARNNKDRWIMAFDPATAKTRVIATQHDDAWVNFSGSGTLGFLSDHQTIYFVSEQSGYLHLSTAPYEGGGVRPLTQGAWEVTGVTLSDDKKFFDLTTSEESPFEKHLYRLPVAGGARDKLTSMPGNNDSLVSPDHSMQAIVYSYTNKPPELYIQPTRRGAEAKKVTSSPIPEFWSYPWLDVPIVRVPARDGAQVPARIYKRANLAPGGPAVIFVHGAGYLQNVHRWWSSYFREYMFHHLLMERGYLVLDIDYRASAGYGRDWRTAIFRHMGGKDLDDQVDAARWLVREQGVDAKRIGIYGGSYGGFITLMAMFTQPDVFAAGAALRPVTDWAHYNHPYTANILNTPQSDPEAYRRSSPIYFAEGLRGALLMCHGITDVNVHAQDTIRLAQKLIELRKENWEMALYPIEDHSFVEPTSWADEYKRILKLFEENLK